MNLVNVSVCPERNPILSRLDDSQKRIMSEDSLKRVVFVRKIDHFYPYYSYCQTPWGASTLRHDLISNARVVEKKVRASGIEGCVDQESRKIVFVRPVVSYIAFIGDAMNRALMTTSIRPIDSKYADRPTY